MKFELDDKPIERATVFFEGDRSVGIPDRSFDLEMYYQPSDLDCLNAQRKAIADLYENLGGERPKVMFDFEMAQEAEAEAMADAEQERLAQEYLSQGHRRYAKVSCPQCKERFDSNKVQFVDISSDVFERDLMTFVCPNCRKNQTSLIFV